MRHGYLPKPEYNEKIEVQIFFLSSSVNYAVTRKLMCVCVCLCMGVCMAVHLHGCVSTAVHVHTSICVCYHSSFISQMSGPVQ